MSKVHVFDHPLIQHKLSYIRDAHTGTKEFRELVDEVGMLMAYEVTRDLELQDVEIQTPVTKMTAKRLAGKVSNCTYFKSWFRHDRWCVKSCSCC